MTKTFPIGVLLSITTGRLLCEFGDMHECAEFLCGESVWTHQFAYEPFNAELKRAVLVQHPQLEPVTGESVTTDNWQAFLADQTRQFGELFNLIPMAETVTTLAEAFTKPLEGKEVLFLEVDSDAR